MLSAWLTIGLMIILWLCAFVALAACAPILLTARRERWVRRLRRTLRDACEAVWWLGPRPTLITIQRRSRPARTVRPARMPRRRAA
jgi:hypothetical protein